MYCYTNDELSPYEDIWYRLESLVLNPATKKAFCPFCYKSNVRLLHYITVLSSLFKEASTNPQTKLKMKYLIVFALVIVAALAAPAPADDVQILKNDFENIGIDGYKFA